MEVAAYEAYRKSGIKWMPDFPSSWDDTFVKICFHIQLGKMLQSTPGSYEDIEVSYLKAQHVNWNGVNIKSLPRMFASESEVQKFKVENGDLLVCEGGEVGRAAILENLEDVAIIQNAIHRVRGTHLGNTRYFNYLLRNIADAGWFAILCNKATIAHLTGEKLGAIRIPVPSIKEQTQIAKFLDYKTTQIDRLIEKKKALIEKLNEKRTALITQAVTKGLNPDVPMKDSGVDWLGEVPEHWEVRKLKWTIDNLKNGIWGEENNGIDDIICIRVADFDRNNFTINDSNLTLRSIDEKDRSSRLLKPGDLLIEKSGGGENQLVGAVVQFDKKYEAITSNFVARMSISKGFSSRYLTYLHAHIYSSKLNYRSIKQSTGIQNLDSELYFAEQVAIAPKSEQIQIAEFLDNKTNKIDKLANKASEAIDTLNEYRTALITAAVTGKIDVRNVSILE